MATKTKRTQKRDLRALLSLVNRWDDAKTIKLKAALGAKISSSSERFYARWKRDGVVLLLEQCAKGME